MNLGIVTGTVVASLKHAVYDNRRLMVVAICGPDWHRTGKEILAVDVVGAGVGDRVLTLKEGNSSRAILGEKEPPLQEMIVGIVDSVDYKER